MLGNDAIDEKILISVRQDVLWKKIVFENISESSCSLDGLKEQRSLTLSSSTSKIRRRYG